MSFGSRGSLPDVAGLTKEIAHSEDLIISARGLLKFAVSGVTGFHWYDVAPFLKVFVAFDKRHIGEDAIISPMDREYRIDQLRIDCALVLPYNTPLKIVHFSYLYCPIPHYNLHNLVVTKFDSTEKCMKEIGKLRAISSHVLRSSGVQIPQNNLDNLQSIREEEDGATKVSDPRDVPGSIC
ncbi:hypothetical protein Tco_0552967 [Tanacetum coccineum]